MGGKRERLWLPTSHSHRPCPLSSNRVTETKKPRIQNAELTTYTTGADPWIRSLPEAWSHSRGCVPWWGPSPREENPRPQDPRSSVNALLSDWIAMAIGMMGLGRRRHRALRSAKVPGHNPGAGNLLAGQAVTIQTLVSQTQPCPVTMLPFKLFSAWDTGFIT